MDINNEAQDDEQDNTDTQLSDEQIADIIGDDEDVEAYIDATFDPQFMSWGQNYLERFNHLTQFAGMMDSSITNGGSASGSGSFMLLHYDLITRSQEGALDRSRVYEKIKKTVYGHQGTRIGKSVYVLPIGETASPNEQASIIWNSLSEELGDSLKMGDLFYINYASAESAMMGGIGQIVPADGTPLMLHNAPQ